MVFIFQFVNMVYHIDLWILKNPCNPVMKPTKKATDKELISKIYKQLM